MITWWICSLAPTDSTEKSNLLSVIATKLACGDDGEENHEVMMCR